MAERKSKKMEKEKEKLSPGDPGYPGGVSFTTARINGQTKEVRVVKDAYGNVVYIGERTKAFGIF